MVLSSAIVCVHDRRIADDRRSSFHMIADLIAICDPRSYGNQPLDRTWFYRLRSRSQDRRRSQTLLRSAIIWKPAFTHIYRIFFASKCRANTRFDLSANMTKVKQTWYFITFAHHVHQLFLKQMCGVTHICLRGKVVLNVYFLLHVHLHRCVNIAYIRYLPRLLCL